MSTIAKSTALYPHPFSKAYWHDAAAEMKSTKILVIAALMIALRVATKGLAVPIAPNLKLFSVASFINALGAMIVGPVVAIPAAFISDFLGVLIWEGMGTYFLPYALQEIGSSLIWALLLYRAKVTPWRVMLGRLSICVIVNVFLGISIDMLYQQYFYGASTVVLTIPRVLKNTFMFPIEAVAMTFFLRLMVPITNRMGLTYGGADSKENLVFGKKQIALLIALFVAGVACVTGYLFYYYDTTSLSASYTAEERYETNCQMTDILLEESDAYDGDILVTTVESAYQKFLGKEITYNVAVYTVDETALANYDKDLETIRGLSKSKAKAVAEDGVMTLDSYATIVLNKKTGEIVSWETK
ncbi:MAG: hypothetical protein ACI3V4_09585 [Faecousia sp.]